MSKMCWVISSPDFAHLAGNKTVRTSAVQSLRPKLIENWQWARAQRQALSISRRRNRVVTSIPLLHPGSGWTIRSHLDGFEGNSFKSAGADTDKWTLLQAHSTIDKTTMPKPLIFVDFELSKFSRIFSVTLGWSLKILSIRKVQN